MLPVVRIHTSVLRGRPLGHPIHPWLRRLGRPEIRVPWPCAWVGPCGRGQPRGGPSGQLGSRARPGTLPRCPAIPTPTSGRPSPFLVEGRIGGSVPAHRRRSPRQQPSVPPAGTPAARRGLPATPRARPLTIRSPSGDDSGPTGTQPDYQHRDSDATAGRCVGARHRRRVASVDRGVDPERGGVRIRVFQHRRSTPMTTLWSMSRRSVARPCASALAGSPRLAGSLS